MRGERVLYFAFEEAPQQIIRNMKSVNIQLQECIDRGTLKIFASRPTAWGLELHLASIHKTISEFDPDVIIIDPVSNLITVGTEKEVRSMLTRLIDHIKTLGITSIFTDLIIGDEPMEKTDVGISSLMDSWILVKNIEIGGERNRGIYILKARGISHSNQIREFLLTSDGIDIIDVYKGSEGVLTGTARVMQEARMEADELIRKQQIERLEQEISIKEKLVQRQIETLKSKFETEKEGLMRSIKEKQIREEIIMKNKKKIGEMRNP